MSWTDERVETLKRMWNEGQSASQIAKEIGGVTRNAVIGKVHRLGLSNRTAPTAEQPAAAARPVPVEEVAVADDPAPARPAQAATQTARPEEEAAQAPAAPTPAQTPAQAQAPAQPEPQAAPPRRQIIPAGQPLPPQPSANEISPEVLASVREVEKRAKKLTLMELTERTCKWPVGDPATPDFWFCGLPTQQSKPYCEAHVGVAFQPMSARRDRRR
jgi:GcrA cell cycle regulator